MYLGLTRRELDLPEHRIHDPIRTFIDGVFTDRQIVEDEAVEAGIADALLVDEQPTGANTDQINQRLWNLAVEV